MAARKRREEYKPNHGMKERYGEDPTRWLAGGTHLSLARIRGIQPDEDFNGYPADEYLSAFLALARRHGASTQVTSALKSKIDAFREVSEDEEDDQPESEPPDDSQAAPDPDDLEGNRKLAYRRIKTATVTQDYISLPALQGKLIGSSLSPDTVEKLAQALVNEGYITQDEDGYRVVGEP